MCLIVLLPIALLLIIACVVWLGVFSIALGIWGILATVFLGAWAVTRYGTWAGKRVYWPTLFFWCGIGAVTMAVLNLQRP